MTLDTLIEILEKIKESSKAKVVEIHEEDEGPWGGYYDIASIVTASDGRVVLHMGDRKDYH